VRTTHAISHEKFYSKNLFTYQEKASSYTQKRNFDFNTTSHLREKYNQKLHKQTMQKWWDPEPHLQCFFSFEEKERGIKHKPKTSHCKPLVTS
jgi:hypothetical protein